MKRSKKQFQQVHELSISLHKWSVFWKNFFFVYITAEYRTLFYESMITKYHLVTGSELALFSTMHLNSSGRYMKCQTPPRFPEDNLPNRGNLKQRQTYILTCMMTKCLHTRLLTRLIVFHRKIIQITFQTRHSILSRHSRNGHIRKIDTYE